MAVSRSRPGDPAAPSSLGELEPGHVLDGRYRLLGRIGHGGFGDVWRAVELLHDGAPLREVALKILAPQFVDADWAEEAKLLASFSPSGPCHDLSRRACSSPWAPPSSRWELLIGQTLAEHLKRDGRLPWRVALRFARSISQALDVIHGRGVVHLDLKPANVFVTADGNVKVLDFGISRGGRVAKTPRPTPRRPRLSSRRCRRRSSSPSRGTRSARPSARPRARRRRSARPARSSSGRRGSSRRRVLQKGEPTMLADAYALGVTLAVLATGRLPQQIEGEEPGDLAPAEHYHTYLIELRDATLRGQLRDPRGAGPASRRRRAGRASVRGRPGPPAGHFGGPVRGRRRGVAAPARGPCIALPGARGVLAAARGVPLRSRARATADAPAPVVRRGRS
jgi:serine/threonine protein kinase